MYLSTHLFEIGSCFVALVGLDVSASQAALPSFQSAGFIGKHYRVQLPSSSAGILGEAIVRSLPGLLSHHFSTLITQHIGVFTSEERKLAIGVYV